MLSHTPRGRTQIAHLRTHAYTPRLDIHRTILSIFIPDKDTKYNNKSEVIHDAVVMGKICYVIGDDVGDDKVFLGKNMRGKT